MWTGAILAGGQSRRLGGRNKARLTLAPPGGASVLDRQLARLSRVVDRTIIVANDADAYRGSHSPIALTTICGRMKAPLARCTRPFIPPKQIVRSFWRVTCLL